MVGAGRNPQLCGECFGLFGLEPGGLEVASGGERVEGGCEQSIYSGGRAGGRITVPGGRCQPVTDRRRNEPSGLGRTGLNRTPRDEPNDPT